MAPYHPPALYLTYGALHVAETPLDVHGLELVEASQYTCSGHTSQNVGPYKRTATAF